MVDVEKLHKAIVSEAYGLSYFGPTGGHLKECPGFGDGRRRLYVPSWKVMSLIMVSFAVYWKRLS